MKTINTGHKAISVILVFTWLCAALTVLCSSGYVLGQGGDVRPRISLEFIAEHPDTATLRALVRARIGRSYEPVVDVPIDFYRSVEDSLQFIGTATSDQSGRATLAIHRAASGSETYFSILENQEGYRDASQELAVRRADLDMQFEIKDDTVHVVKLVLSERDSTAASLPVDGVPVRVYVQRLFGTLPVNEGYETTDSDGILELEFPQDIKGDTAGIIHVIARVEEHDDYGTLVARSNVQWGVPLEVSSRREIRRELWSARANAPIPLMLLCNALILGIWGTIIYLVFQVAKIYRIGKNGNDFVKS